MKLTKEEQRLVSQPKDLYSKIPGRYSVRMKKNSDGRYIDEERTLPNGKKCLVLYPCKKKHFPLAEWREASREEIQDFIYATKQKDSKGDYDVIKRELDELKAKEAARTKAIVARKIEMAKAKSKELVKK